MKTELQKAAIAKNARKWRAMHPEKDRLAGAKWRAANPERVRARSRAYNRIRYGHPNPTRPEPEYCENCGRPPNGNGGLHLDHDHKTGVFRGWLCYSCNIGLGYLGDSAEGLLSALRYLSRKI